MEGYRTLTTTVYRLVLILITTIYPVMMTAPPILGHLQFNKRFSNSNPVITKSFVSMVTCYRECKSRKTCLLISYHRATLTCYLHKASDRGTIMPARGFIYSERSNWETDPEFDADNTCPSCSEDKVCNPSGTANEQCVYKECLPPAGIETMVYRGNALSTGKQVRYFCKPTYDANDNDGISTCDTISGQWTIVGLTCTVTGTCGPMWTKFSPSCYQRQSYLNPTTATYVCSNVGAYLVKVETTAELNFILTMMTNSPVLVDGVYDSNTGKWTFSDTTPMSEELQTSLPTIPSTYLCIDVDVGFVSMTSCTHLICEKPVTPV